MTLRLDDKVLVSGPLRYVGGPIIVNGREVPGVVAGLDQGHDKDRVLVALDGGRSANRRNVMARYANVRKAEA